VWHSKNHWFPAEGESLSRRVFLALAPLAVWASCFIAPIDLSGRACDASHPCAAGWTCVNSACVTAEDAGDSGEAGEDAAVTDGGAPDSGQPDAAIDAGCTGECSVCCAGCCSGGKCHPGTTALACGSSGGACIDCGQIPIGHDCLPSDAGNTCGCTEAADCPSNQACDLSSSSCGGACDPGGGYSLCNGGCCDLASGMCTQGNVGLACGASGGSCEVCPIPESCVLGDCVASTVDGGWPDSGGSPDAGAWEDSGSSALCRVPTDCPAHEACDLLGGTCGSACGGAGHTACNGGCCGVANGVTGGTSCQLGTSSGACGSSGSTCSACVDAGEICVLQVCQMNNVPDGGS
jgi:hypothetical protein